MRTRTPLAATALWCLLFATSATSDPEIAWTPGEKGEGRGYTYQVFSQQKEDEPFVRYQVRGTIDSTPEKLSKLASELSADPKRAPKDQTRRVILKTDN
ncbi:MAG TPA: hypothetical protein VFC77_03610, partial [Myxococcota bacterium]|nr:hypothetical protein [Myxococcota bacterium]